MMYNTEVYQRKDDKRLVVCTNNFVSHAKGYKDWSSTFSLSVEDAKELASQLDTILQDY